MTRPLEAPGITPRPGGWEFSWPDDVHIRLERLREHHDSVTAELWAEQGAEREHLVGGLRFNLTTSGGRSSLAKALLARRNGYDWGGMMEQVCVYALRRFREQEQPIIIGALPTQRELRFRLRPVLPEGVSTLLFGYGGSAKTTLALAWGLLVQMGEPRLGLEPAQSPVMLLDWETNQEIANNALLALSAGLDLAGVPTLIYHRCRRPLAEFVEELKAEVEQDSVGLVILDSLGKACGGEKELKENALPTMTALEWLGTTNLIISHRPRSEEGRGRGAYGSIYVENDARQAFRVEDKQDPGEPSKAVALFHTKYNLMAPLPPIGYRITWDPTLGTRIEHQEVAEMEDIRGQLAAVYQIEHALKASPEGRMTAEELAADTGLKEGTVRETLRRYKGSRFVSLEGRPAPWGLKTTETPEQFR